MKKEKPKVLILEDEIATLEKMKVLLENEDFIVIAAANTKEAKSKCDDENSLPDIALLDVNIAGEGILAGLDFAEWLREFHFIPIFFITTNENNRVVKELEIRSISDYIFYEKQTSDVYLNALPAMLKNKLNQQHKITAQNAIIPFAVGKIAIKQPKSAKEEDLETEYIVINVEDITYAESIKGESNDVTNKSYTKLNTFRQEVIMKFPIGSFKKYLAEGIGMEVFQQNFIESKFYVININSIASFTNRTIKFERNYKAIEMSGGVYDLLKSKIARIKSK